MDYKQIILSHWEQSPVLVITVFALLASVIVWVIVFQSALSIFFPEDGVDDEFKNKNPQPNEFFDEFNGYAQEFRKEYSFWNIARYWLIFLSIVATGITIFEIGKRREYGKI